MKVFRPLLLGLALLFAVFQTAVSQNNPTNLPPLAPPNIGANTPDWALEMYSAAPNVNRVDRLYREYFKKNTFVKTTDTRNYKHWRRYLSRYNCIGADGKISIPTEAERAAETEDWLRQKDELDKMAPPDRSPTSNWAQIGPFENTGTGTTYTSVQSCQVALAQCTGNLNVLYSVSQNGKIFKTSDHGENWAPVGENYFFQGDTWTEQCISVHPTNPDIVYYGSGTQIWKTTDGGTTWAVKFTLANFEPNCIIIHPTKPDTLLISSDIGIYRSHNGGTNFNSVRAGKAWDLRFKTNDPATIFAICRNGTKSDFYKSTDGGTTWPASITGWFANPQDSDNGGRMTVSTGNPNLIYCFIIGKVTGDPLTDKNIVGVAKSTDAGANWTLPINWNTTQGINAGQGYYDLDIEVSDADDNLVMIGTQGTWKTTNGFTTVTGGVSGQHADPQEYHFNGPNDFWVASDGGIDLYNSTLTTRASKSRGITGTEFWGFDQGWNEDTRVGSYYHNGTSGYRQNYPNNQFRATGGAEPATGYISVGDPGKVWFNEVGGKYLPTAIDGTVGNFSYNKFPTETYWSTWQRSEIAPHPLYFNTHFLGNENILWKTTDGGVSFSPQYTFGTNPSSIVTAIEISRSNPNFMLVYQLIYDANDNLTSGILWKSTDGGTTFSELLQPASVSKQDGLFISIDPADEQKIWISYNKTNTAFKVFKSTNGGAAWTNITGSNLNGLIPEAMLHIGGTDGGIYIMTPHSVFYRNNTHSDWQPFGNALPAKLYNNYLRPFYKEKKIRMATIARGLWSVDFYENPTAIFAQPTVDKATSSCHRDTFQFDDFSMLAHAGASWAWAFSPAPQYVSSTSVRNPKVVFGAAGNYQATLTITDGNGLTSTKTVANMVTLGASDLCGFTTGPEKSLSVNGTSNYAATATAIPLGTTNTITIAGWIKPTGTQVANAGIFFSASGNATGLNFRSANQLGYHWADGAGSYNWSGGATVPADVWSHVAIVVEATKATVYLNGVASVRTAAHAAVNFSSPFHLGNDRGNTARTMTGEMDEIRFYNRALTQNEIRELRHLTYPSYAATDAALKCYLKFNENSGIAYDRVGLAHASLLGTATRTDETGAFAIGVSERQTVPATAGSSVNFTNANLRITFGATTPNGELCVSRLDDAPRNLPTNFEAVGDQYWVVNNHGTTSFASLTSMVFSGINVNSTVASRYKLYKRASNAHLAADWIFVDEADAVTTGTSGAISFSTGLNVTGFSQFAILQKGVRVAAKMLLQGPFNSGTGILNDQLRSANLIPVAEPYTNLGFGHVEGGGESTAAATFLTTGNDAIVDWVFVELRDKNNPATKLFTRSALLQKDGDVVDLDGISSVHFANAAADNYFIAVKHRNHLAVRTAAVVSLTENATVVDFSNNLATIYKPTSHPNEAAATLAAGKYGLWAGNTNGDDWVKMIGAFPANNDYLKLLNTLGSSTATQLNVYSEQDLNMDGAVKMIGPFPSNNDYLKLLNVLGSSTNTILQAF